MEELLKAIASEVALVVETIAVGIVAYGAFEALARTLAPLIGKGAREANHRLTWVRFGSWLLLGLQFALAADIVHSAIAPNWTEIGQLAAIAAIRTFLNFFLERDLAEMEADRREPEPATRPSFKH